MYEMETELVRVTENIGQAGLKGFAEGNAKELAKLRDKLTDLLEQVAR